MSALVGDSATVQPAARLRGELRVPGDKSISHRALMLAAMAAGESRVRGAGDGADGVMVEVHPTPDQALSDAEQQLTLDQFRDLMETLVPVHAHVRGLHGDPVVSGAAMGIGGNGGLAKH